MRVSSILAVVLLNGFLVVVARGGDHVSYDALLVIVTEVYARMPIVEGRNKHR